MNKTYADYLASFWQWLHTVHCDHINTSDVVFLRGVSTGNDQTKGYLGVPVVNVADNALRISKEQGIFFCNITSCTEAIYERANYSEAQLRAQCLADLNQSTIPNPMQILIDGEPIRLPPEFMADFRTVTSEFILRVPEAQYGESLAPFMDVPLDPGDYRCVAAAYCFMIVFDDPGDHTIYSVGRGKPWMRGEYISELLYEILVSDRTLSGIHIPSLSTLAKIETKLPITNAIYSQLDKMEHDKLIDSTKVKYLKEKIELRKRLL